MRVRGDFSRLRSLRCVPPVKTLYTPRSKFEIRDLTEARQGLSHLPLPLARIRSRGPTWIRRMYTMCPDKCEGMMRSPLYIVFARGPNLSTAFCRQAP